MQLQIITCSMYSGSCSGASISLMVSSSSSSVANLHVDARGQGRGCRQTTREPQQGTYDASWHRPLAGIRPYQSGRACTF